MHMRMPVETTTIRMDDAEDTGFQPPFSGGIQQILHRQTAHVIQQPAVAFERKRTARAVLTGMCYSAGSAMRHGSSSLTRLTGLSAMTPSTWRR